MDIREARRQLTLSEATRLTSDVETWVSSWKVADSSRGRYGTQLEAISSEVLGAVEKVRSIADADAVNRRAGDVFSDYNLHDQRLVWVRYAWHYFKEKLDQRNDEVLRPTLDAADEVSWGCYAIFFVQARLPVPAAPIPYIEYDYVPSALRTGQAHVLNRRPGLDAGLLKSYFANLPVPLLRLPPATVTSPWSLALIAHEVGHLLQANVEPAQRYFVTFADRVRAKVVVAGANEEELEQWAKWSQEIFADLCMASTLGAWSVWALAPWVITRDEAMTAPLDYYPPPATRLYLLRELARAAGFDVEDAVAARLGLSVENSAVAKAVAGLASEPVTVNGISHPISWFLDGRAANMDSQGRASQWSKALIAEGKGEFLAQNDKTSARDAVLAATHAHFHAVENDGDLVRLRDRTLDLIRECHDTGKRAGREPIAPEQSLKDVLFGIADEDILGSAGL